MIGDILQPTHLLFILVIALLVLGPKRLPEVGRSLGRGLRDFRSAISGENQEESHLQQLHSGEDHVAPQVPAEATVSPPQEPAAATVPPPQEPEVATMPGSQEPAGVSADREITPKEPSSISTEQGSTGSA